MKKLIAILITAQTSLAFGFNDNPNSLFDASNNDVQEMNVIWKPVDNVQKVCETESRRRGHNGFGYAVNACSFWEGKTCTIITKKQTNMHALGHELRHCFQGNWH